MNDKIINNPDSILTPENSNPAYLSQENYKHGNSQDNKEHEHHRKLFNDCLKTEEATSIELKNIINFVDFVRLAI